MCWQARTEDGLSSKALLPVGPDGRFARDVLLAGAGELLLLRRNAAGNATELARKSLELRAGERVEVEF